MIPDPTDREYVDLPGVTTLRPEQWYLVEPDGTVHQGTQTGWARAPYASAELVAILELNND